MNPSVHFTDDQPSGLEHSHVLADGQQGHVEGLGEFAHHGGSLGQTGEERSPRSVRERVEYDIEALLGSSVSGLGR